MNNTVRAAATAIAACALVLAGTTPASAAENSPKTPYFSGGKINGKVFFRGASKACAYLEVYVPPAAWYLASSRCRTLGSNVVSGTVITSIAPHCGMYRTFGIVWDRSTGKKSHQYSKPAALAC